MDQVVIQDFDGPDTDQTVTGLSASVTAYGPADRSLISGFNISNFSAPGVDHFGGLSLPTDPAVYLGFPKVERTFNFELSYGDGDYANGVNPYEFFDTNATYGVTSVRIAPAATAVPEPSTLAVLVAGVLLLVPWARRRQAGP